MAALKFGRYKTRRRVGQRDQSRRRSPAFAKPVALLTGCIRNRMDPQSTASFNSHTASRHTTIMADTDNATRAPESDAQAASTEPAEQSIFSGDTRAQQGPSMGVSTFLTSHVKLSLVHGTYRNLLLPSLGCKRGFCEASIVLTVYLRNIAPPIALRRRARNLPARSPRSAT